MWSRHSRRILPSRRSPNTWCGVGRRLRILGWQRNLYRRLREDRRCAGGRRQAREWTRSKQRAPHADEGDVRSIAFNPDGKRVVTASDNKTARLALAKGSPERPLM